MRERERQISGSTVAVADYGKWKDPPTSLPKNQSKKAKQIRVGVWAPRVVLFSVPQMGWSEWQGLGR